MAVTRAPGNGHGNGHANGSTNGHSRKRWPRSTVPPPIAAPHPADADGHRELPHSHATEQSVLGAVLAKNDLLGEMALDIDTFYDLRHKAIFAAMSELAERKEPIDVTTVDAALERSGKLDAIGGPAYLGEITLHCPTVDNAHAYARELRVLARNRKALLKLGEALERGYAWPHDPGELVAEVAGEMQRLLEDDPSQLRRKDAPMLANDLWSRRSEPWVNLKLGNESLGHVRGGGVVIMIGGSGSGKTSLATSLLIQHARDVGPAVNMSLELPSDEWGARVVGIRGGHSWPDVLRGEVRKEIIDDALNLPRLCIVDRGNATLENLGKAITAMRLLFPGDPIMVAIDYVQLMDSKEWDARAKVADIMTQIDDLARRERVVVIAISQMGRASAREARSGDRVGSDTTDLGAESASLERWATLTLAIGKKDKIADSDEEAVELSIGKSRMGEGDRVVPMVFAGRTGAWRVAGDSQPAEVVRAARAEERDRKRDERMESALLKAARASGEPLSRRDLRGRVDGRTALTTAAIERLVASGTLVEVAKHAPRSKLWLVWTPDRARAAGLTLVRDIGEQTEIKDVS